MKIISWNVNGIRAASKKGFVEFIEKEDPDILCLQETKAHPDQLENALHSPLGRQAYWSSAEKKGYSGTVTYVRSPLQEVKYGIGIRKFDSEGRFVVTKHADFILFNVYFPNGAASDERHVFKQEFLMRFTGYLKKLMDKGENVIVVGDYNVAYLDYDVHDPKRLSKISGFLPEEREWFKSFLATGFIDTFRYKHPEARDRYSWWSYRENARVGNKGWRIDHICVSPGLEKRIVAADILDQQFGSDHCPVMLELKD